MQVFLPYEDFYKSLSCLDPKRLGNQVYRECKTLVNGGWKNHPVAKIWQDHTYQLCEYALTGLWVLRNERQKPYQQWEEWFTTKQQHLKDTGLPPLIGYQPFHDSHKSNLLRKNPEYYSQFNWHVPDNLPYIWKKE